MQSEYCGLPSIMKTLALTNLSNPQSRRTTESASTVGLRHSEPGQRRRLPKGAFITTQMDPKGNRWATYRTGRRIQNLGPSTRCADVGPLPAASLIVSPAFGTRQTQAGERHDPSRVPFEPIPHRLGNQKRAQRRRDRPQRRSRPGLQTPSCLPPSPVFGPPTALCASPHLANPNFDRGTPPLCPLAERDFDAPSRKIRLEPSTILGMARLTLDGAGSNHPG